MELSSITKFLLFLNLAKVLQACEELLGQELHTTFYNSEYFGLQRFKQFITVNATIICTNLSTIEALDYNFNEKNYDQFLQIANSSVPVLKPKKLAQFGLVKKLFLSGLKIETIVPEAFYNLTKLEEVYLDDNKLANLSNGVFAQLRELRVVNLTNNKIEKIGSFVFMENAELEELYLRKNQLKVFDSGVLKFSRNVKILDLAENPLVKILGSYLSLHTLILSETFLGNFAGNFSEVSKLYLSYNHLTNLTKFDFSKSKKLQILDFSDNQISLLIRNIFNNLNALEELFLQNNEISEIDLMCFQNLTNLKFLNLSNNQIYEFQYGTFDSLKNLEVFDISNNRLKHLFLFSFHSLSSLRELYFRNNQIHSVDFENFNLNFPKLELVALEQNFWSCQILVEMKMKLTNIKILPGTKFDMENVHGIACHSFEEHQEKKTANISEVAEILKKSLDGALENSQLAHFLNQDFETLKQDERPNVEKLTEENSENYYEKIIVAFAVIQVLVLVFLLFVVCLILKFLKLKNNSYRKSTPISEMKWNSNFDEYS